METAATAPASTTDLDGSPSRSIWPRALIVVALAVQLTTLRITGQPWWCSCGEAIPWSFQTKSLHNSQHFIDAYSLSHMLHGVIFYFVIRVAFPSLKKSRWPLLIATVLEVGWELLENSPIVINRYRDGTAALGYSGDSVLNSVGDVASMISGLVIAQKIGWRRSIALYVIVELGMLWWIRDNLTLNVVMLIHPIDAIKQWQMR